MSGPLLRFEDGKIALGGKDLLVKSASLSLAPTLNAERVYGDYDPEIAGARTEFVNFAPVENLKGTLDVSFFIYANEFAEGGYPNTINRMFDIYKGMDEKPINQNLVGRYAFDNMFLKSFSFSLNPFEIIIANAKYDIFGSVSRSVSRRFQHTDANFAHGLKSFGSIAASASSKDEFEIASLNYNIIVNRQVHNKIRASENTFANSQPGGVIPARVSVESIEKEMVIECSEMVENLNVYGDQQSGTTPEGLADSKISAFLLSMTGEKIAKFSASGKIQSQSLSISEGQYAKSSISIKEIVV